jgi:hypothetical protein
MTTLVDKLRFIGGATVESEAMAYEAADRIEELGRVCAMALDALG